MPALIDTGVLDGQLAVEIDCSALNPSEPEALVKAWRSRRVVGAGIVRLDNAPWAHPDWATRVVEFLTEPDAEDHVLWVERVAADRDWCAGNVWWVLDGSELLGPDQATTIELVRAMPYIPAVAELVVRSPQRNSIQPASLDELAGRIGADQAWLYVDPADLDTAVVACSRAGSQWGIRVTSG